MSAQISKPGGFLGALLGLLGLSVLAGLLVTAMVAPALAVTGAAAKSGIDLFENLPDYIELDAQSQKNTILAYQGGQPVEIAEVFYQNREEISWDEVSQFAKDALVAGEDRRFYEHGGVDMASIIRAAVGNAAAGETTSGASTLTMQLVKNILVMEALNEPTEAKRKEALAKATESSFDRKIKEAKYAIGLEKRYTKDEILLGYLNIAGFGGNTYGIQSAAQEYFSVNASDLTLAQSASLIAIVQTPSYRSLKTPDNYERNQQRRDLILNNMLDLGYVDAAQHAEAIATPITVVASPPQSGCLYATAGQFFCDYVTWLVPELESLGATEDERRANWKKGGYTLQTTLDLDIQAVTQDRVSAEAPATETRFELGAAASSVEAGTGRILAMAQNKIYNSADDTDPATTAVNYNTDRDYGGSSGFQVGSTYKIFTLAEWLKNDHGLNETVDGRVKTYDQSTFQASCTSFAGAGPWKVPNFGGAAGSASTTVMRATTASINSAYAAMAHKLDQCAIRDTALSLGVHRANNGELQANPAAILGTNEIAPLSMAAALAAIANNGTYCAPIAVEKITNAAGEELPGQAVECQQALTPEVAAGVAHALTAVVHGSGGTGNPANPRDGTEIAGKTGTTDAARHTWMVGTSTKASLAVWVGNIVGDANLSRYRLPNGNANDARYKIFRTVMQAIDAKYPAQDFPQPPRNLLSGQAATVPDVTGQSPEQARALLESLGFVATNGATVASTLPAGRVAATNPGAGAQISRGSTVSMTISDGSLDKTMPELAGTKRDAAQALLASNGFTGAVTINYVLTPDPAAMCMVVSSDPPAGTPMSSASPLTLNVNSNKVGEAPPEDSC
ncbi:MAG: penicillin-binding protein [Homoserinimonas sp.]|nr:penicillin-binding protein [Homoserinimonas sp.]